MFPSSKNHNHQDNIKLLDTNLLKTKEFKIFQYWKKALAYEVGWHYPLDIVWILKELGKLNLKPNSLILDAGGGYGLLQFILAAKGYDVVSIDLAPRKKPLPFGIIFRISSSKNSGNSNLLYARHLENIRLAKFSTRAKLVLLIKRLAKWTPVNYLQAIARRGQYGSITFHQADLVQWNESDKKFDAVVSVSALEHNKSFNKISKVVNNLENSLKPGAPMIITTSASNKESWYHKPSNGWCFEVKDLNNIFNLIKPGNNFGKYPEISARINQSRYLRKNLPGYYFYTKDCGMPFGIWDVKYLPVGIIKWKSKSK